MRANTNTEQGKSGKGIWILKSLLCAYLMTGILLLVLTLLLYQCNLEEKHITAGILVTYLISTLSGGFAAGKMAKVKKFVWGLTVGSLYFALLVLISFGIYHHFQEDILQMLIVFLLCAGGGMIGGMLS